MNLCGVGGMKESNQTEIMITDISSKAFEGNNFFGNEINPDNSFIGVLV